MILELPTKLVPGLKVPPRIRPEDGDWTLRNPQQRLPHSSGPAAEERDGGSLVRKGQTCPIDRIRSPHPHMLGILQIPSRVVREGPSGRGVSGLFGHSSRLLLRRHRMVWNREALRPLPTAQPAVAAFIFKSRVNAQLSGEGQEAPLSDGDT